MTKTKYYEIQSYPCWLWNKIDPPVLTLAGYSFNAYPFPFLEATSWCAWKSPLSKMTVTVCRWHFKTCLKTLSRNKIDFLQEQRPQWRRNEKQAEVDITGYTPSRQSCSSKKGVVSLLYGDSSGKYSSLQLGMSWLHELRCGNELQNYKVQINMA